MRNKGFVFLIILALCVSLIGCSLSPQRAKKAAGNGQVAKEFNTKDVAATVNGEPILRKEVDAFSSDSTANVDKMRALEKIYNFTAPPVKTKDSVLKELIREKVIAQDAKKHGVKVAESDVDASIKQQRDLVEHMPKDELARFKRAVKVFGYENLDDYWKRPSLRRIKRISLIRKKLWQKLIDEAVEKETPPLPFDKYVDQLIKKAQINIIKNN